MKRYAIYQHPLQGVQAVKRGFSWPAFFFGIFWMLAKRLWTLASLYFAGTLVLMLLEAAAIGATAEPGLQGALYLVVFAAYLALWLLPALQGNRWRESDLARRGYQELEVVDAPTPDAATARFAQNVPLGTVVAA